MKLVIDNTRFKMTSTITHQNLKGEVLIGENQVKKLCIIPSGEWLERISALGIEPTSQDQNSNQMFEGAAAEQIITNLQKIIGLAVVS